MQIFLYSKLTLAVAVVICGIALVIVSPSFLGFVALLTALYSAGFIATFPASLNALIEKEPIAFYPAAMLVAASIIAVVTSSFNTDGCYIKTNPRLVVSFMEAQANPFRPLTPNQRQLAQAGLNACALEPDIEILRVTIETWKAKEIGPVTTTGLNTAAWDVSSPKSICVAIYQELKRERPDLFVAHQHELRCLEGEDP